MYALEDVEQVHLEITTRCNAACPQCARNIFGSVDDPSFELTEIYLDEFKSVFQPDFIGQLKSIFMCGTFGDPSVSRDCLKIWEYIKESNPNIHTNLHTNGGARSPSWWKELAGLCTTTWFGIDGLEDTNHLYRQGVSWKRLMENAEAYIAGGGRAVWVMNVFKHNQHQVDQAKLTAMSMGFKDFIVRKTARFYWPSRGLVNRIPVYTAKGEISHFLEMPTDPVFLNEKYNEDEKETVDKNTEQITYSSGVDHLNSIVQDKLARKKRRLEGQFDSRQEIPQDVKSKFDSQEVCCKAQANKELYVSASGLVWPCCFLSINEWGQGPMQFQVDEIFSKIPGRMDTLDFRKHSLEEIIDGDFFQKHVPESWKKSSLEAGKLYDCAYWCPKEQGYFQSESDVYKLK
jgi:hypothetical protein